jgi:hypothetical protein
LVGGGALSGSCNSSSPFVEELGAVFSFFVVAVAVEDSGGRCSVAAERAAAALARVCRALGEENETMAEH